MSQVNEAVLDAMVAEHVHHAVPRYERLWQYYRNPLEGDDGAGFRMAQERGLPDRLRQPSESVVGGRERVIENDIGWRVHTLVDFMFGRPVVVQSLAEDPERATLLEQFLRAVFEVNGGVAFFQDLALLGAVYGFVDVLVDVDADRSRAGAGVRRGDDQNVSRGMLEAMAQRFRLETIEAPRAIAMMNPSDYRRLDAYAVHVRQRTHELAAQPLLSKVRDRVLGGSKGRWVAQERTQVWTAEEAVTYRGRLGAFGSSREVVSRERNRLGRIPVVHIQNLPQPLFYEGLSEVEPLIPLQNELNTRLSDRANRVTFQSFKMYLGKGIEQFTERPIGPGQMWATDNPDATIQEFGGDGHNPSEEIHIDEIRAAMDKTSGVTPVAAGLLRGKVGNLTSENALRMVMMGLLAKTEKKRVTYGAGIGRLCELVLHAADVLGVLPNDPSERRVRLDWPSPLPDSEKQQLQNAAMKLKIGVPRRQVLAELGYAEEV